MVFESWLLCNNRDREQIEENKEEEEQEDYMVAIEATHLSEEKLATVSG